jgi:hypothetical protein
MSDDDLLTLAEASVRFGLSHGTLRLDVTGGKLPALRIGRRWYVCAGDMPAYLADWRSADRAHKPMTSPPPSALRSMVDLAREFKVDNTSLIKAAQQGRLTARQMGGQWVATREDAIAYLAAADERRRRSRPSAPPADYALLEVGELIDLYAAAAYAGLSKLSIANYAKRGRLAAKQLGSQWVTTRAAVDAYLASRIAQNIPKKYRRSERPSGEA